VEPVNERFGPDNARDLIRNYDLVLDGADNFPTRYLINDAAVLEHRPIVHGSIFNYEGQVSVFSPPAGPCYRCLFPEPTPPGTVPSCAEAGVLGVLPGVIGTIQATEAIKLLTGIGTPLIGKVLTYDALDMSFRKLTLRRDPTCALCGNSPTITSAELIDWACDAGDLAITQMDIAAYNDLRVADAPHLLLDVRERREVEAGSIDGSMHIPLSNLADQLPQLEPWRDGPIVCQCQSGIRSQEAAELLRREGFRNVVNLAGGYLAWLAADTST
jgi:rhodanese-related sulfurtransferase